jgi:MoxR-like ATPase
VDPQQLATFIGQTLKLAQAGSWPATNHRVDRRSVYAILAAVAAHRPLLVRGEPGVGKSQLARAAAHMLGSHFISFVVQPATEYQDLLWTFDQVARLGEAQMLSLAASAQGTTLVEVRETLHPLHFLSPGPIWWAYDWQGAAAQAADKGGYQPTPRAHDQDPGQGVVVLLDEIDKADIDLPNGLLETLGNNGFDVPYQKEAVRAAQGPPLVVITSNNQRELPAAFVRRCVVLDLALPEGTAFQDHLVAIGKAHFPGLAPRVLKEAARQTQQDREQGDDPLLRVGQAEYLDLLRALADVARDTRSQMKQLKNLSPFILGKHAAGNA